MRIPAGTVRDHKRLAMLAVSEEDGHEDWFAPCAEVMEVHNDG